MTTNSIESDLTLVAIVAMAENRVIGRDGTMPWDIPADMRHFKRVTTGHPVIMGRVTYEGILEGLGEPLPERTSIVLSRGGSPVASIDDQAVSVVPDVETAVREAARAAANRHGGVDRAFVAGGGSIYEQFLPLVDRLVVTEVHDAPEGDTHFPTWNPVDWAECSREDHDGYSFVTYERS